MCSDKRGWKQHRWILCKDWSRLYRGLWKIWCIFYNKSDAFSTIVNGLDNAIYSVAKALNSILNVCNFPHIETSSLTNNVAVVGPSLKGALLASSITLITLYSPYIFDLIHPIRDGFYVLNLYFFDLMFTSIHLPDFVWQTTIYFNNKVPNHIPYGFSYFNLFNGMGSGNPLLIIDYKSYAPFSGIPSELLTQIKANFIDFLVRGKIPSFFPIKCLVFDPLKCRIQTHFQIFHTGMDYVLKP